MALGKKTKIALVVGAVFQQSVVMLGVWFAVADEHNVQWPITMTLALCFVNVGVIV